MISIARTPIYWPNSVRSGARDTRLHEEMADIITCLVGYATGDLQRSTVAYTCRASIHLGDLSNDMTISLGGLRAKTTKYPVPRNIRGILCGELRSSSCCILLGQIHTASYSKITIDGDLTIFPLVGDLPRTCYRQMRGESPGS